VIAKPPCEADPFVVRRETRARAALVSHRISARLAQTATYRMRVGPGIVRVRSGWRHSYAGRHRSAAAVRSRITNFTNDSRRRMEIRFRESEWPQHRLLVFITLTWPRHFSAEPRDWKAALRAWRAAYERQWGPLTAIWALEFQRRGAPHFHLACAGPRGVSIEELRRWSAETWYRIAGHGDERHLHQHQKEGHCKRARTPNELLGYLAKEIGKRGQKELPAWLTNKGAGRWWGVWRLVNVAFDEPLTRREFHAIHRVGRRVLPALSRAKFTRDARGRPPAVRVARYVRGTRWVLRPHDCSGLSPRDCAQPRHWIARPKRTRSIWRPDLRWVLLRDRSPRPWTLAQAVYNFKLLLSGTRTPRSSYARWDDKAAVQLRLGDTDTLRDLLADVAEMPRYRTIHHAFGELAAAGTRRRHRLPRTFHNDGASVGGE
jgi:hypothetical protein